MQNLIMPRRFKIAVLSEAVVNSAQFIQNSIGMACKIRFWVAGNQIFQCCNNENHEFCKSSIQKFILPPIEQFGVK
jgi:hypothetical protein